MGEMSAKRERKYSDWGNAWGPISASVFPTCGRWRSWPNVEGHSEQAIDHLREAAGLAAELGLPGERWQIQAALGTLYEAAGEPAQARTAWASAARIIQELAQGIKDETLRTCFLAGSQIHPVLQHTQSESSLSQTLFSK